MILVNGDSWTKRDPAPEGTTLWTEFLTEETGQEITNIALPGSSNQRIYRTTLEQLYTTNNITHLIIGWSSIVRTEVPTVDGKYLFLTPLRVVNPMKDQYTISDRTKTQIYDLFYRYCYNENIAARSFLIMLLTLQDICKQRNIRLINFHSFNNNFYRLDSDCKKLYNQLDLSTWVHIDSTMEVELKEFPFEETNHVGTLGNAQWAKILATRL